LPWKWSRTTNPSQPGSIVAASSFNASNGVCDTKWRLNQAMTEPVDVCPPSMIGLSEPVGTHLVSDVNVAESASAFCSANFS